LPCPPPKATTYTSSAPDSLDMYVSQRPSGERCARPPCGNTSCALRSPSTGSRRGRWTELRQSGQTVCFSSWVSSQRGEILPHGGRQIGRRRAEGRRQKCFAVRRLYRSESRIKGQNTAPRRRMRRVRFLRQMQRALVSESGSLDKSAERHTSRIAKALLPSALCLLPRVRVSADEQ